MEKKQETKENSHFSVRYFSFFHSFFLFSFLVPCVLGREAESKEEKVRRQAK
uniref:Uncharacterized protein MANES_13G105900 n=1 Tax=Rhizophora mucronata TaxID=61149 RepID=A0A2P2Q2X2_RHIMU